MNAQIREEAAEWLIEFRTDEADASTRERFVTWLRTSPEHVRAYLELVALWEDASHYDPARTLDVDALIAPARAATNVVALETAPLVDRTPADPPKASPYSSLRNALRYRLAAAAMVGGLAATIGAWFALHHDRSYATEVGEQRSIRLEDGSNVELNALSRIRVRFSDHERAVDLLAGQVLFRVAKNKDRPFVVVSGDTRVRAVGTQFDVNRKRSGTIVTVLEGRVAIVPQQGTTPGSAAPLTAPAPMEIGAGEQVTVTARSVRPAQRANVVMATAWTQQQLIFESTPLPDVAEEFNRFNTRRLVIEGAELDDFHVSGTFSTVDPASLQRFLRFLREQPGIEVLESGDQIVVTKK
jgi:transmembrane sensor